MLKAAVKGRDANRAELSRGEARRQGSEVRRWSGAGQREASKERARVPAALAATTQRVRGKRAVRGGVGDS